MAKARILIVEDERIVAEDIKRTLQKFGYAVSSIVSSGTEAVKGAKKENPDLVLVDIILKGRMNGIEAAEQIRSRLHIPVIYITAYADKEILKRAKVTEPYGYIIKPFDDAELRSTLEIALYKSQAEKKVQESEARLQKIIYKNADGIVILDRNGTVRFANPAAVRLFGVSQQELVGELFGFPVVTGETTEIDILQKNGKKFVAEMRTVDIEWEGETADLVSLRDLTSRKKTEHELQQSLEKSQRILLETVEALAVALEMRDPYTAGHSQRVAQLASAIAKEMDLSEEQIKGTHIAAAVHDIGKISIPADILNKPRRLTEPEFSIVKTHPQVGYEILKNVEFFWPIAQIVLQHHERINGSGYPQGLVSKDILLEAKILGVADVVEAMCSYRPYRPAPGLRKALEEVSQKKGILYDSDIVDVCVRLFNEKGFKFAQ